MMSASSRVSSAVSVTRTGVLMCWRSSSAKASRDSGRRPVTRISSRSNSESSMVTLENAVPRAPMCPRILASLRARCLAPTAVIAPVRTSVISVASMTGAGCR